MISKRFKVIGISLFVGMLIWVIDAVLDHYIISKRINQ